jgi:hypothetical protein
MATKFIRLSELQYTQYGDDVRLNAVQANDGFYYVDANCLNTAPEIFTGNEPIVEMNIEAFPQPKTIDI